MLQEGCANMNYVIIHQCCHYKQNNDIQENIDNFQELPK